MTKFDIKTINFGRVEYTTSTVHVYSSPHDRTALLLPCMRVSFGCQMDRSNYSSPDVQWLDLAIIPVPGCDRSKSFRNHNKTTSL